MAELSTDIAWNPGPARSQQSLDTQPYDRWLSPDGDCKAEFHRVPDGILVRFPGEADFHVDGTDFAVSGWPVPEVGGRIAKNLYRNAITPMLGNHDGGLFLHGSAARIGDTAFAFLGHSRSGKTTLAGAFARSGMPFLTEDVVDLVPSETGYDLRPKFSALRLFKDSADHLFRGKIDFDEEDRKQDVAANESVPFAESPAPLGAIYILGEDHEAPLTIRALNPQEALGALMPHSFILDVEDKRRLRSHFGRLADLSERVACFSLDYPRQYSELPGLIEAILEQQG